MQGWVLWVVAVVDVSCEFPHAVQLPCFLACLFVVALIVPLVRLLARPAAVTSSLANRGAMRRYLDAFKRCSRLRLFTGVGGVSVRSAPCGRVCSRILIRRVQFTVVVVSAVSFDPALFSVTLLILRDPENVTSRCHNLPQFCAEIFLLIDAWYSAFSYIIRIYCILLYFLLIIYKLCCVPQMKFLVSAFGQMGWKISDCMLVLCQKLHIFYI